MVATCAGRDDPKREHDASESVAATLCPPSHSPSASPHCVAAAQVPPTGCFSQVAPSTQVNLPVKYRTVARNERDDVT